MRIFDNENLSNARFNDSRLDGSRYFRSSMDGARVIRGSMRNVHFRDVSLRGAKIRGSDLRDVELDGGAAGLTLQGVEVEPLVEAELDRRHPERAVFRAEDSDSIRSGWELLVEMWERTVNQVSAMPDGTCDISVDAEFSFAQTLRHLTLITDGWLGQAILGDGRPFHPLGVLFWEASGLEESLGLVPPDSRPSFQDVLDARSSRLAMISAFMRDLEDDQLSSGCGLPVWAHGGRNSVTVIECLRIIFEEEWHHHRYATRDLRLQAMIADFRQL